MLIATLCDRVRTVQANPMNPNGLQTCRIPVRAGRYYEARASAFQEAQALGHTFVLIRVHGTRVSSVHQGLKGPLAVHSGDVSFMNMLLDVQRQLIIGHAAIFIAPRTAVDQLEKTYTLNHPVIPMVAGYNAVAALSVPCDTPSLGYNLVQAGFSTVTSKRHCYTPKTGPVLDEYGTVTTWNKNHALH